MDFLKPETKKIYLFTTPFFIICLLITTPANTSPTTKKSRFILSSKGTAPPSKGGWLPLPLGEPGAWAMQNMGDSIIKAISSIAGSWAVTSCFILIIIIYFDGDFKVTIKPCFFQRWFLWPCILFIGID
jgi:hypothetical protein